MVFGDEIECVPAKSLLVRKQLSQELGRTKVNFASCFNNNNNVMTRTVHYSKYISFYEKI